MRFIRVRSSVIWFTLWIVGVVVLGTTQFGYAFTPTVSTSALLQAVAQSDRFGIDHVSYGDSAPPSTTRYVQATDAGARWNRWSLYWHDVERSAGSFDFSRANAAINADREYGLEPLVILQGTPGFYATGIASTSDAREGDLASSPTPPPPRVEDKSAYFAFLRGEYVRPLADNPATRPPAGLYERIYNDNGTINQSNRWAYFVYRSATEFRGRVHAYEIWNEPDFSVFWTGSVADYVQLLRVAHTVIKNVDPNAKVLVGGMMFWEWVNRTGQEHAWLRAFMSELAKDANRAQNNYYFDGIPWHFYSRPSDLYTRILSARSILTQNGITGKEMWVTETSSPVCGETPNTTCTTSRDQPGFYAGGSTLVEQASYVLQAFAYSFAASVNRTYIFQHYDDGNAEAFGLFRNSGTLRPAYTAYEIAARYLGTFDRVQREGSGSIERIVFYNSAARQRVHVIFNTSPTGQFATVPASSPNGTIVHQDGTTVAIPASNGTYQVWVPGATNNRSFNNVSNDYIMGGWTQLIVETYALDKRVFLPVVGR